MSSRGIRATIEKVIAPEANHLLTAPPTGSRTDMDFGWFCREHTIVANSVLTALGKKTEIVYGDITVHVPNVISLSTITATEVKHFWCTSGMFPILDISVSVRFHTKKRMALPPVTGFGQTGDFEVIQSTQKIEHLIPSETPKIIYTEIERNPDLLIEPAAGHIAACISLHIIDLIEKRTESMLRLKQEEALPILATRYPDASERISEIQRKAHNQS